MRRIRYSTFPDEIIFLADNALYGSASWTAAQLNQPRFADPRRTQCGAGDAQVRVDRQRNLWVAVDAGRDPDATLALLKEQVALLTGNTGWVELPELVPPRRCRDKSPVDQPRENARDQPRENTREHNPLWIATFAAFIARGWGSRDALVATDRALEMIRNADAGDEHVQEQVSA